MVLGMQRGDGSGYDGTPSGSTRIRPGDTLILYGHADRIAELDERRAGFAGEQAHVQAVTEQEQQQAHTAADADQEPEAEAAE